MTGGLFLFCVLVAALIGAFVGGFLAIVAAWNWPINPGSRLGKNIGRRL